jgi:hypothetical protein
MKWILGTVLSLSLLTAGCADPVAPATPTPVQPTITETFTGTLTVLGVSTFPFTVQQPGGVTATITEMTPSATVLLGVGSQGATGCTVIQSVETGVPGTTPQLSGTASVAGNFCVAISDPGNGKLVEPVNFTIIVRHP